MSTVSPREKAEVLIEVIPYIKEFCGKTVVIKYGGSAMVEEKLKEAVILDLILLKYIGINPVVVHGGGPEINDMLERVGKKTEFIRGLRVTDKETAEICEMVLVGKINKRIVSRINRLGGKGIGLSGKDAGLIKAKQYKMFDENREIDIGYVGEVETINSKIIDTLSQDGYIPVIAPTGFDKNGETMNINADHVAAEIAVSLGASKLILLTDVEGVLDEREDVISSLDLKAARDLIVSGQVNGGMIPKLEACMRVVSGGVRKAHIIDGRKPHSMLLEVFTEKGIGTMLFAE